MAILPQFFRKHLLFATHAGLFSLLFNGVALGGQRNSNRLEILWQHPVRTGPLPLGCFATPVIGNDGSIYVPAGNFLYALNSDGSEKWVRGKEQGLLSLTVAIGDKGTIYAVSDALFAFDADGTLRWHTPVAAGLSFSVAIDQAGQLYFMDGDKLCAMNAEGGIKWKRETQSPLGELCAPIIGPDGTIYTKGNKQAYGGIQAFDSAGALKWKFEMDKFSSLSTPAVDDLGNIYFGELSRNLYALDNCGRLKWVFKTEGGITFPPAIGPDRTIYAGCADGNLYAINPNGELKRRFHTIIPSFRRRPSILKITSTLRAVITISTA